MEHLWSIDSRKHKQKFICKNIDWASYNFINYKQFKFALDREESEIDLPKVFHEYIKILYVDTYKWLQCFNCKKWVCKS